MKIKIGSRGSELALIQTNWVKDRLEKIYPQISFEVVIIRTMGDVIKEIALDKIGDKGIFVKEIEQQLLDGKIDLAIHSMKDMPSQLPKGLKFAKTPLREDPRDVLIFRDGIKHLDELPIGARIGTGSKRRKFQLLDIRSDLNIVPLRGNVETRINKIQTENLDGVILAAAGVLRVGLQDLIGQYLSNEQVLPSPAQGALAIEIRESDKKIESIVNSISDEIANIQVTAERAFMEGIDGSCHVPIGAYCEVNGDDINLTGLYGDKDGIYIVKESINGKKDCAKVLGYELSEKVLNKLQNFELKELRSHER